jgi:hypothetical protein
MWSWGIGLASAKFLAAKLHAQGFTRRQYDDNIFILVQGGTVELVSDCQSATPGNGKVKIKARDKHGRCIGPCSLKRVDFSRRGMGSMRN